MANQIKVYDPAFFKSWEAFADLLEKTFDCPTSGGEEVTLVRQMQFQHRDWCAGTIAGGSEGTRACE